MDDPIANIRRINEEGRARLSETIKHQSILDSNLQTQQIIVQSFKTLVDFLDHKVTKTQVVNQLQQIGTPDALKVVGAVNALHDTLKTHENVDLSEVTGVMRELLEEARQIPKSLPEQQEIKLTDYTPQLKSLEKAVLSVEKVVKAQKLIAEAPIVNVPETQVNVEAPDLTPLQTSIKDVVKAVKKVVIPDYSKHHSEVEKQLEKTNKLLQDILEAPSGGGGGGGVSTPTTPVGDTVAVPTTSAPLALRLDDTSTTNVTYIGKAKIGATTSQAVWQIQKMDETSGLVITWADGNSNFDNVWNDRVAGVYS